MDRIKTEFYHTRPTDGFRLQSGQALQEITLAYESYGSLNADRSNAILLFHAMTGSQHAAKLNDSLPEVGPLWTKECHIGWWNDFIGPGKALDTDRFFVVCINYIGGCYGSSGPCSIDPDTDTPYGRSFPHVTISDVVDSQLLLLDALHINCLHAVIGSSTGGLLSLNLATRYPQRVRIVIPIAAGLEVETLQQLHILEQIYAIENHGRCENSIDPRARTDPNHPQATTKRGLLLARMIAHKAFVSLRTIDERAQAKIIPTDDPYMTHPITSPIESYMFHQGRKFIDRFDCESYLRILYMWLSYRLLDNRNVPTLQGLFSHCRHQRYLLFSISSDVCFYPDQQNRMHQLLKEVRVPSTYITVHSDKGHDSFLLEPHLYTPHLRYILEQPN